MHVGYEKVECEARYPFQHLRSEGAIYTPAEYDEKPALFFTTSRPPIEFFFAILAIICSVIVHQTRPRHSRDRNR